MFTARYAGTCVRCGNRLQPHHLVSYDNDDNLYGVECCGDTEQSNGSEFNAFNRGRAPGIPVMPHGKTKRDACPRCFIIHTVGQGDECE